MSADNWSDCPRCHSGRIAEHKKAREDLAALYGKVDASAYATAAAAFEARQPPEFESSGGEGFREDYQFYLNETGTLEISYRGWCSECGFGTDFEHSIQIEGMPEQ